MNIVLIKKDNRHLVEKFIKIAGDSLLNFRYFKSRRLECLDSHIVTVIGLENKIPVCYGHLDKEDNNVWLGIAVSHKHRGGGLGKTIMKELLDQAIINGIKSIKLSVFKKNKIAQKLYEQYGFKKFSESDESFFYRLNVKK